MDYTHLKELLQGCTVPVAKVVLYWACVLCDWLLTTGRYQLIITHKARTTLCLLTLIASI